MNMMVKFSDFALSAFNPFSFNVQFRYQFLITSESLCFFDIFRGYRSKTLAENGLYTDKLDTKK